MFERIVATSADEDGSAVVVGTGSTLLLCLGTSLAMEEDGQGVGKTWSAVVLLAPVVPVDTAGIVVELKRLDLDPLNIAIKVAASTGPVPPQTEATAEVSAFNCCCLC